MKLVVYLKFIQHLNYSFFQLRGETIVSASCNYGTSALVTGKGHLYMFGKDACYCDSNGRLNLPNEHVTQVRDVLFIIQRHINIFHFHLKFHSFPGCFG